MDTNRSRTSGLHRVVEWLGGAPSRALLAVQLLALLLYAVVDENRYGQMATSAISVGVLAVAVWMVQRSPRTGWVAALLSGIGIALWGLHLRTGWDVLALPGALANAAAYGYAAASLISYMLQDERTTADELWAAAATFMLFVEAYAWIFMACMILQPDAFVAAAGAPPLGWVELLFLSGTNFSATGLSDILPATPTARMLAIIEQWNGVMYLAIVVARLAGMIRPVPRDRSSA